MSRGAGNRVGEGLGNAPIVPRSGLSAALTGLAAAVMAFLAVLALALALAADRLAARWDGALEGALTLRIAAPSGLRDTTAQSARAILEDTPGLAGFAEIDAEAQLGLLEPWFGNALPAETLSLPVMFDLRPAGSGFDAAALRGVLAAELPEAVLDDHGQWRAPLVSAAAGLRLTGYLAVGLTGLALAAVVGLAAGFSMASHAQVIGVLRLIGARDRFISRAFTRRFTARAGIGAVIGTLGAMALLALLPGDAGGVLSGLGPQGRDWLAMAAVPLLAALVAWATTMLAARRMLRRVE